MLNLDMTIRTSKLVSFFLIVVIFIENFRLKYCCQIWNHPDSLVFAAALAEVPSERIKWIADAKGRVP